MHIGFRSVLVATLLTAHSWLLAAPLLEGQAVPILAVKDQHDQAWQIKPDTVLLIYSASRDASSKLQAILAQQDKDFLDSRRAVYLANMSRMPAFITRTMALPSLRELPFRLGVVMDGKLTENWPQQENSLTLIMLKEGKVSGISYASNEASIRQALGLSPS